MQEEVLDGLEDLGYAGELNNEDSLIDAISGPNGGAKSVAYSNLVGWLTGELGVLCSLEEQVNPIVSSGDHSSFLMELSSFIKEMNCPHKCLLDGPISQRLSTKEHRLLLLSYLIGELQAARMIYIAKPDKTIKVEMTESDHARDLKVLLMALLFSKPPTNISPSQLFTKVKEKVNDVTSKASPSQIGKPLFTGNLTDKQWSLLAKIQQEMQAEYRMRREMLIKRLEVTIQSFQWSGKAQSKENELTHVYRSKRDQMYEEPSVSLGHLLAAREDVAILEKTSNASVRKNTKTNLNRIIIGQVPDRGGRAHEHEPPPPEMPSWTQRSSGQGGGGRGGGFNRGEGGGGGQFSSDRVQGSGWNKSRGGGGYQGGGGGRGYQGGGRGGGGYQGGGRGGYNNQGGSRNHNSYDNQNNYHGGGGGRGSGGGYGGRGRGRY